ncbi:MAG: ankyrin repeat domain-containing protein [Alphaproteobacteria bacterium]|nr:ankyrin repeat domain-containing protein [Alphaproteobacteria bacterium]
MKKFLITIMLFASVGAFGMRTNLPASDQSWRNPLITAVRVNDIQKVKRLINKVWSNKGQTVVRLLLVYKNKEPWSREALQNYLDLQDQRVRNSINEQDADGNTPLNKITQWDRNIELIKYLVDQGADPNIKNKDGDTPLIKAVWWKSIKVTKYLIDHGADVNSKNRWGDTVLTNVLEKNNNEIAKYLIDHGANVNLRDRWGDTILIKALEEDNDELVKYLVEHGADVNSENTWGDTVLIRAIEKNNNELVKYLVECGAYINRVYGKYLNTPLHYAVISKNKDIVKYLVKKGAYVNIKNTEGKTPISLAEEFYGLDSNIVQILYSPGSKLFRI